MKAYLPGYQMIAPTSLPEALKMLSDQPDYWHPFAGGTDLMVLLEAGKLTRRNLISLWSLNELKGIQEKKDYLEIGSLTTFSEIQNHKIIQNEFPMLLESAKSIGAIAIQNRATLGGNLANASPAADSSPVLLVYNAEIELISRVGSRIINYGDFHLGYKKLDKRPEELIYKIRIPRPSQDDLANRVQVFQKVGTRKTQAISKVCFAGLYSPGKPVGKAPGEIRIALGGVSPTVLRCKGTEKVIQDLSDHPVSCILAARQKLAQEIAPIDDIGLLQDTGLWFV